GGGAAAVRGGGPVGGVSPGGGGCRRGSDGFDRADLPAGEPSSRVHSSPGPLIRFPARRTLPQQRCLSAVGCEQPGRRLVPPIQTADETDTARHHIVEAVYQVVIGTRLSLIQRRPQPTEDLCASGQVVAVLAWLQPGGVEVFRPPAHTGVAAVAAVDGF